MKSVWVLMISLAVAGAESCGMAQFMSNIPSVDARALIHTDGTRTDMMKDPLKHQMTETTYDARGVVISKKMYLLNENGDPTQGQIFDGAGNLIARVQFVFDNLQRLSEERCVTLQGEVFRRVLHQYDSEGKALPLKAMDYKVNSPSMRTATVDFTHSRRSPQAVPASTEPVQPGSAPQIESVSPTTGEAFAVNQGQPSVTPQQVPATKADDGKKKRSALNPLNWFKKKDPNGN
jgi:hypothetical protein